MSLPDLKAHQAADVEWIQRVGRGLLANEPGTGKSRSAITAFDGGRVLVVAPSLVITGGTWDDEITKWARHPEGFTIVPYSQLNERELTGKGSGSSPVKKLKPEVQGSWDALIVDEAHYTKGRSTSWTWAVEQIAKRSGSVLEMTGTPMPNWAHELYTLLRVMHPDEAKPGGRFGAYWRWVHEWFVVAPSRFNKHANEIGTLKACVLDCAKRPPTDPCQHFIDFTEANLGEKFRRVYRKDCLDLPPVTTQVVDVAMSKTARSHYKRLKKDFSTLTESGVEVVAWNTGSLNTTLDRVTTSEWFLDKVGPPRGGKLEMLRFDLEGRASATLVLAHYRETVDACVAVAQSVGASAAAIHGGVSKTDKGERIAAFKAGKLDVLVGSLETLAEGLTLTVADMAIFVEMSYKPSRNTQARYRIDRLGQTRPVTIREYVTPSSVDANKRKMLAEKTDEQMRVMSAADFAALL